MWIYLVNYFSFPLYRGLIKNRKWFCIIVSFQLFLILALRDVTLGVDLPTYAGGFEYIKGFSLGQLLSRLHFIQVADLKYPYVFESGYVVLNWIIGRHGGSFHTFLVVCAMINSISIGSFIYRYSDKPMLSFAIFTSFGAFTYCFGILRQSLALSIVLFAIPYIINNRVFKSCIIIALAFLFHRTAIIILPLVFLYNIKIKRRYFAYSIVLGLVFCVIGPFLYSSIIRYIMLWLGRSENISMNLRINNLYILMLLIAAIIYCLVDFQCFENKVVNLSGWAFLLSVVLESVALYNDVLARAVQLTFVFIILLIPEIVYTYGNKRTRRIMEPVIYFLLGGYLFYLLLAEKTIVPYRLYH